MRNVADILSHKGSEVFSIDEDAPVFTALETMADKNVGALLVFDGGRLTGIISERDYARKVILQGRSSRDASVREIMTSRVFYVGPEQTIEESMALMIEKHIRHLPVFDEGDLVGVISIGDVVNAVISEQQFVIEQMEHYITDQR